MRRQAVQVAEQTYTARYLNYDADLWVLKYGLPEFLGSLAEMLLIKLIIFNFTFG